MGCQESEGEEKMLAVKTSSPFPCEGYTSCLELVQGHRASWSQAHGQDPWAAPGLQEGRVWSPPFEILKNLCSRVESGDSGRLQWKKGEDSHNFSHCEYNGKYSKYLELGIGEQGSSAIHGS